MHKIRVYLFTVEFRKTILLEVRWGDSMAIILDRAVPPSIINGDVDFRCFGVQRVLDKAIDDGIQ